LLKIETQTCFVSLLSYIERIMFLSMEGAVNLLELERELQALFGVRSTPSTWYLKEQHLIFVDKNLKDTYEFHKYTDGSLSPVLKLVKKHKTISSQITRLRDGKLKKLAARVHKIISKRYSHREEMNIMLAGINDKDDPAYQEYLQFQIKLNSKAESLRQQFLRLPHRTGKDLKVLTDFPMSITMEDIIQEMS